MRHAEILKRRERADRCRDQIVGHEQKRADDGDDFAAMSHARVHAAAVRIKPADDHVVDADEGSENTHRRDQPKGSVTGNRESQSDDVGLARAPIAIENSGRARHIHVARTLDVCCYHLITTQTRRRSRDEPPHCSESVPTTSLPFNVANEVSCRAGAIKCSRCRASFAPIGSRFRATEFGSPAGSTTRQSIKRNKELAETLRPLWAAVKSATIKMLRCDLSRSAVGA